MGVGGWADGLMTASSCLKNRQLKNAPIAPGKVDARGHEKAASMGGLAVGGSRVVS